MSERSKISRTRLFVATCVLAAAVLATACASTGDSSVPRGPTNEITPEQIAYYEDHAVRNVYEMLERARPRWLRSAKGSQSVNMGSPRTVVYLDQQWLENLDDLRSVPLTNVRRVRWLSAAEADLLPRAGNLNLQGAVVVYTVGDWDR